MARIAIFWKLMLDFFKATETAKQSDFDTLQQVVLAGLGRPVSSLARTLLPAYKEYSEEWEQVHSFITYTGHKGDAGFVLGQLKMVADGVRDARRLDSTTAMLPLY